MGMPYCISRHWWLASSGGKIRQYITSLIKRHNGVTKCDKFYDCFIGLSQCVIHWELLYGGRRLYQRQNQDCDAVNINGPDLVYLGRLFIRLFCNNMTGKEVDRHAQSCFIPTPSSLRHTISHPFIETRKSSIFRFTVINCELSVIHPVDLRYANKERLETELSISLDSDISLDSQMLKSFSLEAYHSNSTDNFSHVISGDKKLTFSVDGNGNAEEERELYFCWLKDSEKYQQVEGFSKNSEKDREVKITNAPKSFIQVSNIECLDAIKTSHPLISTHKKATSFYDGDETKPSESFCFIKKKKCENFEEVVSKTYDEKCEVKVSHPRSFNPSDRRQRLQTFHGYKNDFVSNENLSSAGFFLNQDGTLSCFSCLITHDANNLFGDPFNQQWHQRSCRHMLEHRSSRVQLGTLASDGRISDDIVDPPGQQSIYIPPGDIYKEAYRLSTFEHFSITCSISRKSLAKSGFFFTGYYDRVKCFACGRTVQQWVETDNPADSKWHKSTCPFVRGEECGNIPLPNLFEGMLPVLASGSSNVSSVIGRSTNTHEEVLEQRDPSTGAIIRRVRYSSDLPERIRQTGGTFEIGPNNQVVIRSGPAPAPQNPNHIGLAAARQPPRRQWRMANVISADHKRFLTNLYLNRELDRLASFARWPVGRPNIAPAYLAKSGFFYLGDMDRTQCFSCGGVLRNWKLEDDADAEHRAHFPQCPMVLGTEARNILVSERPETEEERERKYPCRFPSNPHMRSEISRQATFDHRWPMRRVAATPAEIAQAGFFFLGERDRAKCWYCNGGLQNWEYDDIPWIEHAKWFPNCQFLLRVKGQHFVHRHLATTPHLARPIIARQDGSPLENIGQPEHATATRTQRSQDVAPRVNRPEPTPIIIDPQVEMRRRKEKVDGLMRNSEIVKFVIAMGFDRNTVTAVLEDRINSGEATDRNEIYENASDLLDDVSKKEEELKREEEERQNQASANSLSSLPSNSGSSSPMASLTSSAAGMASLSLTSGFGKYNVSYNDDEDERSNSGTPTATAPEDESNSESLRQALEAINEERLCKICFSSQADMVFIPCSHLCCCMECTQAITQCPICRKPIQKAIKTYNN